MWRSWLRVVRVGLAVALLASGANAVAGSDPADMDDGDDGHTAIVWVGTVATNLFYIPAKIVYASFGGLMGGIGWAITGGDNEVANGIWRPSVQGTYLLTPGMLEGKDDVHFIGP